MVENEFVIFSLYTVLSYFLGSIPFGYLFIKYKGLGDIRSTGSGNIGATNVLRSGNKELAALTFICDFLKGYVPVLLTPSVLVLGAPLEAYVGIIAVIGHIFPIWLNFKGGKGVATAAGVLAALSLPFILICGAIWGAVFYLSKTSSIAALICVLSAGILANFWDPTVLIICMILIPLLLWTHRDNLIRLYKGKELAFNAGNLKKTKGKKRAKVSVPE